MAFATHQVQGSYQAFPSRPSWNNASKLKHLVRTLHMVGKTDRIGAPLVKGPKRNSLKISAFKGIGRNDESGSREGGSRSPNDSGKISYVPEESEETLTKSPKAKNVPVSYTSEADGTIAGSAAIQKLFKNWLTLLRTPSPNQVVDEIIEQSSTEISEMQFGVQNKERGEILKAVWCYFLGLDSTIKIPLLIFIPAYLAVNVIYGADVPKELTPFWVLGPLIVALYIKLFQGLCAVYVFSFKQTVKVVKNVPAYYLVAYGYIADGKLKEDIRARLWQPVVDFKNLDYKELSKRKMKDLEGWLVEKYLDYFESIWPFYCRTIRFLKRANLV